MIMNRFYSVAAAFLALSSCAFAQTTYTWDPDANQTSDGGAGTWDLATANWDDDVTPPNTTWVDGYNATFGSGDYQVDLTSAGVTVGDLTYGGGGTLTFKGASLTGSPGDAITVNPGATWDTGGGTISFFNTNNDNNTRLVMASGTLTVTGGGTLAASDNPQNNANGTWGVGAATLDVTQAMTVRGDSITFGAFDTIKLVDGSRYLHDRNSDRTYTNDWELGGTVTFDNKWSRNYILSGAISGTGGMLINFLGDGIITLTNDANSFSGGIEVASRGRLQVANKERLGDAANNITLSAGGILRAQGVDFGSTRDIILSGTGGSIINDGAVNTFGGKITGDGNLQIGNAAYNTLSNRFVLTSSTSDYTGNTTIHNGSIQLGANNALPNDTVLTIGGNASAARLYMDGFNQEVAGVVLAGANTREINNRSETDSTLTLNVPTGESYPTGPNFNDRDGASVGGNINLVKTGEGTQIFARVAAYTNLHGTITVNDGLFSIKGPLADVSGLTVTGANSELDLIGFTAAAPLLVNNDATLTLNASAAGLTVDTAVFGPDGNLTLNVDFGALASGNPSYAAIDVLGFDGFDPSAVNIDVNVSGSGFAVGQFPLIQYSATSPLADIDNFNLVGLPDGVVGTLVNNTGSQSIDFNITEAVRSLRWFGGPDWETTNGWGILPGDTLTSYVNYYPVLGSGDSVLFDDYDGASASVVLSSTLTPQSVTVNNTSAGSIPTYTFSGTGKLSGTMGLIKSSSGDLVIANSGGNDYTGGTIINSGDLILGVDDALPTDGLLVIGGTGTSRFLLSGFNQTVSGLDVLGGNTRQILNTTDTGVPVGPAPTLTVNVPLGEEYDALYSIGLDEATDQGNLNITKSGDGTQNLGQLHIGGDLNVTGGTLQVGFPTQIADAGAATVSTGGNLRIWHLGIDLTSLTVDTGATAEILWNVTDWTGAGGPGVDWPRINTTGDFTVTDDASFTIVIDDDAISGFTDANASFTIGSAGGTVNATNAKFTVDQTGFTAGAGTFSVSVSGSDIILNYTVGSGSAYDAWAAGFPGLTGGFGDDDDLDGVSNGEEWYFFNSNPLVADSSSATLTAVTNLGGGSFTFTHLRPVDRSGVTEDYEWTTDLTSGWTANGASDGSITVDLTVGAPTPDVAGYESVTVTVTATPATANELFARLRLTLP